MPKSDEYPPADVDPPDPKLDGWAQERAVAKGRKVTLTLEGVALHLPGEEPTPRPKTQDALPSVEARDRESTLDGWNVDRVRRSSFPPSAQGSVLPEHASVAENALASANEADGDALALAGRRLRPTPTLDLVSEMSERFALGDYSGALRAAELVLGQRPPGGGAAQESAEELARHYAHQSRQKLEGLYMSRLGVEGRVPRLAVPEREIRWLGLDSRMAFLLSRIDGESDCETIVELSGMPRLEALRSLVELVDAKVIRIV